MYCPAVTLRSNYVVEFSSQQQVGMQMQVVFENQQAEPGKE